MARPELATEPRQEYVDDGYSGTSTSRPAFQRLIQDAQDGKIKTIIVKDFSRFARDYIEAGDYMERIFPLLGVRFISVNDGYDSGMQIGNDVRGLEVAIKNIINASYSRDLSAKIAAADHVMQKKGMYLGGFSRCAPSCKAQNLNCCTTRSSLKTAQRNMPKNPAQSKITI